MKDWVDGVAAFAALASAIAAGASWWAAKTSSNEAEHVRRRIAFEGLKVAAESLWSDRLRLEHLAKQAEETCSVLDYFGGPNSEASKNLSALVCSALEDARTLTVGTEEARAADYATLQTRSTHDLDFERIKYLQAQRRLAFHIDVLERERDQNAAAVRSLQERRAQQQKLVPPSALLPTRRR